MIQILNAEISLIGIFLAVLANMIFGMIWYGPLMGNKWMKAIGKKKSELKANWSDYAIAAGSALVSATFMSFLVSYSFVNALFLSLGQATAQGFILSGGWSDLTTGVIVGLFTWLIASIPLLINRYVWEGTNKNLVLINAAHSLISLLIMGVTVALSMNL